MAGSEKPAACLASWNSWLADYNPGSMPWPGPAVSARHTGAPIPVRGTRGQSPWRSGTDRTAIQQTTAPLQRREAAGRPARGPVRQRASGNERGKSASGSARKAPTPDRPARSERVHQNSRSASHAPDRYPHGPGPQARFAPANRAGRPEGSADIGVGSLLATIWRNSPPPFKLGHLSAPDLNFDAFRWIWLSAFRPCGADRGGSLRCPDAGERKFSRFAQTAKELSGGGIAPRASTCCSKKTAILQNIASLSRAYPSMMRRPGNGWASRLFEARSGGESGGNMGRSNEAQAQHGNVRAINGDGCRSLSWNSAPRTPMPGDAAAAMTRSRRPAQFRIAP